MMKPILPLMIFVFAVTEMQAQSVSAAETVKGYSVAQKRLLLWSTAGFTNIITQNNLDRDSVILIASRVTGLPVLMAYDDKYDSLFEGARLINAGKVVKAVALLNTYRGEEHIELLTELAIWYLHKAGSHKMDLDSANYYIRRSLASATTANSQSRYRCLALLGEYYRQNGNEKESKAIYLQILAESQREGIQAVSANAWKCLGSFHQMPDSIDCTYLNNARALYHKLQLKEREIEAIWDLMQYHVKRDMSLLHNDLIEMLNIQQSIGYKHTLFAENLLAWQLFQQSKLSEVLQHANLAIENMKWSGMTAVEGAFYIRVGSVYGSLGEDDEAISFYMKAIQSGTQENHVYWYKALFHITPVMYQHNRLAEGLEILKRVSRKYPPLTVWEKGQLFTTMADCNLRLHQYKLADQHFTSFLDLLARNPGMDPYDEFADDYLEMINFYLSRSNIKKAQLVAKSGQLDRRSAITISDVNNYLLYKIDSASGNYKSALDHYIKHKLYFESRRDMEQQMAYQAVISKSATDKKNNDIKLLQKEKQLQAARLLQANNTRNWIVGALAFAVILAGLLFYNSTAKQRTNQKLKFQASEIEVQNHQLRHLVIEKDWLVKEIHHRVKNNLQMIISLLNAQTEYLNHPSAIAAIKESRERMEAIAILHQKLYQLDNSTLVNMKSYINELIQNIKNSFTDSERIRITLDIADVYLDISQSVPLGLILNEAITNAVKHAYPGNVKGTIHVSLKHKATDSLELRVTDFGKGLPMEMDTKKNASLGMQLIQLFSEQLEGHLYFRNMQGLEITLSFRFLETIASKVSEWSFGRSPLSDIHPS